MALSVPVAVGIVAVGVGVGLFSALFGVGGGIIMVPFMVLALDLQAQTAEGTSLLVILPTAVAGVISHRTAGYGSITHGLILGAGGIVGATGGALLALRLSADTLEAAFGALLCVVGARMILGARPRVDRS